MNINNIITEIKNDKMFSKYIEENKWLSGSSTTVYPITISEISKQITFQLNTDKRIFNKFIERICKKYDKLKRGYFWKSDGICPSTITFYYE